MKFSIVVHSEFGTFEAFQNWLYPLFILIPIVVLERSDVEKGMRTASVILFDVGSVQRRPAIPDFLHVGFVGSRSIGRHLLCRFLRRSKARKADCEDANQQSQNAF